MSMFHNHCLLYEAIPYLQVVHGGALVTSVCHHVPLIIDLSAPHLEIVEDVFYDVDFDLMAIYYKVPSPIDNCLYWSQHFRVETQEELALVCEIYEGV